ncbi:MAG: hypothetical protein ABIG60_01560 [Patescibacteria group bacterium]
MNTLFYARDIGPSQYLHLVMGAVSKQLKCPVSSTFFHSMSSENLFGKGKFNPRFLVMSLTSLKDDGSKDREIELIKLAMKHEIIVIVLADTYGSWGRPWAQGKIKNAIAIVASEEEAQLAKDWGYKDAIYLGVPPLWQGFAATPAADFKKPEDGRVELVGGSKEADITDDMLLSVILANEEIGGKWYLIFKPHPGETEKTKNEERRKEILQGVNTIDTPFRLDNLLPVVDFSVHLPGATATIIAPYLRAPVISFESDEALRSLFETIPLPYWPPSQMGACAKADQNNITDVITELLTAEGREKLRKRQEEVYPLGELKPSEKTTVEQIVDFIEGLV